LTILHHNAIRHYYRSVSNKKAQKTDPLWADGCGIWPSGVRPGALGPCHKLFIGLVCC